MRIAIKILRGVIAVLLAAVLGGNLWMMFQQAVLHREPPDLLGYSPLVVTSGSMEPAFSAGDMIVIHKENQYGLGDIVTFRDPAGALVTHRIVGATEGKFITQGDANNVEDQELLVPEAIVGKLALCIPAVGSVMLFLRTPLGLCILLLAGILLLELPRLTGALKKQGRGKHADGGT